MSFQHITGAILRLEETIAQAAANLEDDDDEAIYERRDHVECLIGDADLLIAEVKKVLP